MPSFAIAFILNYKPTTTIHYYNYVRFRTKKKCHLPIPHRKFCKYLKWSSVNNTQDRPLKIFQITIRTIFVKIQNMNTARIETPAIDSKGTHKEHTV